MKSLDVIQTASRGSPKVLHRLCDLGLILVHLCSIDMANASFESLLHRFVSHLCARAASGAKPEDGHFDSTGPECDACAKRNRRLTPVGAQGFVDGHERAHR